MRGSLRSVGSGRSTWMLSNATSIAWITQLEPKGRQGARRAHAAIVTREKGNEDQTDQHLRGRPGQGLELLHEGNGLCEEGRLQSGPISLADRGLARGSRRHRTAAGAERQPRSKSVSA